MKVVYFIDNLRGDGTQRALTQLIERMAARGHRQTVICLNDSWDSLLVDRLDASGAEVRIVGKVALASGYGLLSMWRSLRDSRFDVAVTLLFFSDVIGRVMARWGGVPRIISSLRARNVHYSLLQRWLVRTTMRSADAVVINSVSVREFAIGEEGASPDRVVVIPNGVCVEDYTKPIDQSLLLGQMKLLKHARLLGTVGRLTQQKGFDVLLRALSLIPNQDIQLVIFGLGEEESKLRELATALGLEAWVWFAGYRRDLPRLLGSLDLYVHPARFEGMPNALLEAMAAGCAIVATSVDGNRELIEDGIHGWLVPAEDPVKLAKAIQEALGDPNEARRRGAAARQRVMDHYSVDAMVVSWEKVLVGK